MALGIGWAWNLCELIRFCLLGKILVDSLERVEFRGLCICWSMRFSNCSIQ